MYRKLLAVAYLIVILAGSAAALPLGLEVQKLLGAEVTSNVTASGHGAEVRKGSNMFDISGGGDFIEPGDNLEFYTQVEWSSDSDAICAGFAWLQPERSGFDTYTGGHGGQVITGSVEQISSRCYESDFYVIDFEAPEEPGTYTVGFVTGSDDPDRSDSYFDSWDWTNKVDTASFEVKRDSDGDEIPDGSDDCPNESGLKEYNGCPPPDTDGDGVVDPEDECPNQGGQGFGVDSDGCPIKDDDGDGVPNPDDECEGTSIQADVDGSGCAVDSDGDGVPDYKDLCPNQGGEGFGVSSGGCPIEDSDGDGVPNPDDKCAGTDSQANVDGSGCAVDSDGDGMPDYRDSCPNKGASSIGLTDSGCPAGDKDRDGIIDSQDSCPEVYGSKTNGCPTFVDSVINFVGLRGVF